MATKVESLNCICGGKNVYKDTVNVKGLEVNQLYCPECGIIMRSPSTDSNGVWLEKHWRSVHMCKNDGQQTASQENDKISSHSERDIVLGCIALCENENVSVFMKESLHSLMGDDFRQEFPWEVK